MSDRVLAEKAPKDGSGGSRMLHTNIRSDGWFYAWAGLDGEWEAYLLSGAEVGWEEVMELVCLRPRW